MHHSQILLNVTKFTCQKPSFPIEFSLLDFLYLYMKWENGNEFGRTFKSKNSGIGVHESGIGCDWTPEWLHGHVHVDDHHAVLRRRFPHAYVLVRFHRHVRERYELRANPHARQLHQQQQFDSNQKNDAVKLKTRNTEARSGESRSSRREGIYR